MKNETDFAVLMQDEMLRMLPTRSRREKESFAALALEEQSWRFLNWLSRGVHRHPRKVKVAFGFYDLPATQANRREVNELIAKIREGADLSPHLSEDVQEGYCLHKPGRKHGPDFDMMLNEWGIHHLHLSSERGGRGFYRRTKDLLYVIFRPGVAYVLAVASHGAWTERQLIEATVRTWPQHRLFFSLDVLPGSDWTPDEHKALRKAGVTVAAVVGGRPWISAITLGITTALVSSRVSKESGRILRCIRQANEHPTHLQKQLINHAALTGATWPSVPEISVRCIGALNEFRLAFVEIESGATLLL